MGKFTSGIAVAAAMVAVPAAGLQMPARGMGTAAAASTSVQLSPEDLASRIANDPSSPAVNGAKAKLIDDPKVQGGKALRVTVRKKAANIWDSAVESSLTKAVKKGDKLVLMFDARLQEGPAGAASATIPNAAIQMKAAPYTTIGNGQAGITGEWQSFRYEGIADKDYATDAVKATIQIGDAKQVIDFGPIVVLNLGQ